MDAIQTIKKYWGFTGIKPAQIIERNQFGNLLVLDGTGRIWRICPEEFTCKVIAKNQNEMRALWEDPEFKTFWDMTAFATLANANLGGVDDEQCYYFIKAGDFSPENIGIITISDLIIDSGIAAEEAEKSKV